MNTGVLVGSTSTSNRSESREFASCPVARKMTVVLLVVPPAAIGVPSGRVWAVSVGAVGATGRVSVTVYANCALSNVVASMRYWPAAGSRNWVMHEFRPSPGQSSLERIVSPAAFSR